MKTTTQKKTVDTLTLNSKLIKTIINAIQEKKGTNIISLNLKKIPESIADFFIICEASNYIQLNAIAGFIEEKVREECGEKPFKIEGMGSQSWVLVDYVNVVIHCMMPETRTFYKLEELWQDAQKKEII